MSEPGNPVRGGQLKTIKLRIKLARGVNRANDLMGRLVVFGPKQWQPTPVRPPLAKNS